MRFRHDRGMTVGIAHSPFVPRRCATVPCCCGDTATGHSVFDFHRHRTQTEHIFNRPEARRLWGTAPLLLDRARLFDCCDIFQKLCNTRAGEWTLRTLVIRLSVSIFGRKRVNTTRIRNEKKLQSTLLEDRFKAISSRHGVRCSPQKRGELLRNYIIRFPRVRVSLRFSLHVSSCLEEV
jgi:hypothetical protein